MENTIDSNMTHLCINRESVRDKKLITIFKQCKKLENVNINFCYIDGSCLEYLPPTVTTLSMLGIPCKHIHLLTCLPNLKSLKITIDCYTEEEKKDFNSVISKLHLIDLFLDKPGVTIDMTILAQITTLTKLTIRHVNDENCEKELIHLLQHLENLQVLQLQTMLCDCCCCNLSGNIFESINKYCKNLKCLRITRVYFYNDDISHLTNMNLKFLAVDTIRPSNIKLPEYITTASLPYVCEFENVRCQGMELYNGMATAIKIHDMEW